MFKYDFIIYFIKWRPRNMVGSWGFSAADLFKLSAASLNLNHSVVLLKPVIVFFDLATPSNNLLTLLQSVSHHTSSLYADLTFLLMKSTMVNFADDIMQFDLCTAAQCKEQDWVQNSEGPQYSVPFCQNVKDPVAEGGVYTLLYTAITLPQ